MEEKICKDCHTKKKIGEFYKIKTTKDGYTTECKICYINKRKEYVNEYSKRDYVKKNKNKRTSEKNKIKYYKDLELSRKKNREARKKQRDRDRVGVNEKRRKYYRHKMETDPIFKIKKNVRNRIWKYTKYNGKSKKTFEIVGITSQELKIYLENQFTENMTWENYGEWHIDHIIPLDSANDENELYSLCYYTNLQPLWGNENIRKGAKILF